MLQTLNNYDTLPPCPACQSPEGVIPVVYGIPSENLRSEQRKGRLVIGDMRDHVSHWYCKMCGREW
ncbi:MAG: hypothetical protein LUQ31_10970 [Methanoregula sp.]|nr:hypothetical protein [Methanoregula sp.]